MSEVLAEHIQYNRLPGRNRLYREALEHVLSDDDTVVDLGCGVGVLGLIALECGASEIWGVDSSGAIHLARETANRAGLQDRYHCIASTSFRAELPAKVDALICDHVGFFGFDYGIIEMVEDARERMLKPGGVVMPQAIDLCVAIATGDKLHKQASAWLSKDIPEQLHWLDEQQRNSRHPTQFKQDDLASDPARLGSIALDQPTKVQYAFETTLTLTRDCRVEGIAGWFDCHLGGGVRMTNSPLSPDSIKREQVFYPVNQPFDAEKGDTIAFKLRFEADGGMITWTVRPPGGAPPQTMTTWKSMVLLSKQREAAVAEAPTLSETGKVRAFVLGLADGTMSRQAIEDRVLEAHPNIFPTENAIRRFVKDTLRKDCAE